MTAATVQLPRGGVSAAQREAEAKAARKTRSNYNDYEFFRLKAPQEGEVLGESAVIRMVTDEPEWIEVKQHSWVKTKPAPKDKPSDKKWLDKHGGVCRYTLNVDGKPLYPDCYICDKIRVKDKNGKEKAPWPGTRLWAVACLRDEIIGTKEMADEGLIESHEVGYPVAYVDATFEKPIFKDGQPTGEVEVKKKFVILNFGMDNFFDKFLGNNNVFHTVVDRDYKITRRGSGTDTDYDIIPLDPVQDEVDGKTVKWDLRRPEVRAQYEYDFDLLEIVLEQASDDHYNWYFNADVETTWEGRFGKKDGEKKSAASATESADEPTSAEKQATLDAIRDRMRKAKASQPA